MIALLDTNAYIGIMRGRQSLLSALEKAQALLALLMLSIVVGELEYGFCHGNRYAANRRQLSEF